VAERGIFGDLDPLIQAVAADSSVLHHRDRVTNRVPLHFAAYFGRADLVRRWITLGSERNPRDRDGNTPLHFAAKQGKVDVVEVLLEAGADPNPSDKFGDTPLHNAVFIGSFPVVRALLAGGADPNRHGYLGWTSLHVAASEDRFSAEAFDMIRLLVENGASVTEASEEGFHPIHYSALLGSTEACAYFLNQGEVIDPAPDNHSPLNQATRAGHLETVVLLVDRGADVNRPDAMGLSPLQEAILAHRDRPERGTSLIMFLLERGANTESTTGERRPPLHQAVADEQQDVVQVLIDHGADVNRADPVGWSPLHWAVSRKNGTIIRLLVAAGADVNQKDLAGRTPLSHAFGGETESLLVALGAR
jgi:ankyrin repeat protein